MKKNIGIEVKQPENTCDDINCPFHSNISLRGKVFEGTIVSNVFHKTVSVEWERRLKIPKYERYEKRRTKIRVHSTPCIEVKPGDKVKIMECRPISKTKNFIIVEKI
ncbi:30S ribosomal protein S17 [Candidatus Woesearchaeota archaeon]|nr:MAG: 30S ribosomal protein S17 [Candidatus Woesearchaeota archaeon]